MEDLKKAQKENVKYNLEILRQQSGLTVLDFCDNANISHSSYSRFVSDKDPAIPSATLIKELCKKFRITQQQLMNTKLPIDYLQTHPDIFFTFTTFDTLDEKLIELIEIVYGVEIRTIIEAFKRIEIHIDFLPNEELSVSCDEEQFETQYKNAYNVKNLVETQLHYLDGKKHVYYNSITEESRAEEYLIFYENVKVFL